MAAQRKSPPYPFILEALDPLHPEVRPMFSGYAVYIGDKIVLMLRDRPTYPEDNGLWLVFSETADIAHKSIRKDFPSLRPIGRIGGVIAHWLLIPAELWMKMRKPTFVFAFLVVIPEENLLQPSFVGAPHLALEISDRVHLQLTR